MALTTPRPEEIKCGLCIFAVMELLKKLCAVHAPSGDERKMKEFLLTYIADNKDNWKVSPQVFEGKGFQDCIVLVFGKPKTAVYAHMDNVGFTVKYDNELIKIGGPKIKEGYILTGEDSGGKIEASVKEIENEDGSLSFYADAGRNLDRGTSLQFKSNYRTYESLISSPFMDNRLGLWNCLKLAENLENGAIVFTAWEEHGGGSVQYLAKFLFDQFKIDQALISDITWVTKGVEHGKGVAISMRDSCIPRRSFVNRIIEIAKNNKCRYQLEVEDAGGSDGSTIQRSALPIDWCFVGAPEDNVHSPDETVHRDDISAMLELYTILMKEL